MVVALAVRARTSAFGTRPYASDFDVGALLQAFSTTSSITNTQRRTGRPAHRWAELRAERKSRPPPKRRSTYTFDRRISHTPEDALSHVRQSSWAHFDESVELIYRLNVDPRHHDQIVRVTANLPHGTGSKRRIAVFADGKQGDEALAAGAEVVGGEELMEKVRETSGRVLAGFDVCLALPEMMGLLAEKVGRKLGPRGLMPSTKTGTITENIGEAVKAVMKGRVWHKVDRFGNLHTMVGKLSFADAMLKGNIMEVTRAVMNARPPMIKRKYVKGVHMCSSMGPGVRVKEDVLIKTALAEQIKDGLELPRVVA